MAHLAHGDDMPARRGGRTLAATIRGLLVSQVRDVHEQGEQHEGHDALPHIDHVWRVHLQDEDEPHVCEDGEKGCHVENGPVLDVSSLAVGNGDDAHLW